MKSQLLSLFSRTPLHVGAGSSVGIVDLPIIRERHTGYPVIPGSSLKGVLADLWNEDLDKANKNTRKAKSEAEFLFGANADPQKLEAGNLLVGEARILAFPVRSAKAGFAWVTCPLALGRFLRDTGKDIKLPKLEDMNCLAPGELLFNSANERSIILEEYVLNVKGRDDDQTIASIAALLAKLSNDSLWNGELKNHLVLLSDEMFKYFVENTCEVAQHVKIDDDTGTAAKGALFNQENVPAETMFYTLLHEKKATALDKLAKKLTSGDVGSLLQIGADATTGLGWCSASLVDVSTL